MDFFGDSGHSKYICCSSNAVFPGASGNAVPRVHGRGHGRNRQIASVFALLCMDRIQSRPSWFEKSMQRHFWKILRLENDDRARDPVLFPK